jgi:hypothetical protein
MLELCTMPDRQIHGVRAPLSASLILTTSGDALSRIRQEDRLTWADIGAVLGKSEDQAAKYADGSAEMGLVAFTRARQAWNGRFTGALDQLIGKVSPEQDGQVAQSCLLKASLALSLALEDGQLTDAEIAASRGDLERSKDAIERLLARLGPKEAFK